MYERVRTCKRRYLPEYLSSNFLSLQWEAQELPLVMWMRGRRSFEGSCPAFVRLLSSFHFLPDFSLLTTFLQSDFARPSRLTRFQRPVSNERLLRSQVILPVLQKRCWRTGNDHHQHQRLARPASVCSQSILQRPIKTSGGRRSSPPPLTPTWTRQRRTRLPKKRNRA